jgi:hypothetical protein
VITYGNATDDNAGQPCSSFCQQECQTACNAAKELKGVTQLALQTCGMIPRLLNSAQIRDLVSKFDVM